MLFLDIASRMTSNQFIILLVVGLLRTDSGILFDTIRDRSFIILGVIAVIQTFDSIRFPSR
jgi:hypothetical protein